MEKCGVLYQMQEYLPYTVDWKKMDFLAWKGTFEGI